MDAPGTNQINHRMPNRHDEKDFLEHEKLNLSGMHCAACVQLIEFRLKQLAGVHSFRINAASHKADVSWESGKTSLKNILEAITQLGYGAFPLAQSDSEQERQEKKLALWRLFVAGFAMMQVMMYAFPAYLVPVPQIDGDLTPDLDKLLKIASMVIAVPVMGFSALPFFQSAWRDIRNHHVGMDVPVSLGILLTFFASVWATFNGGAVYYDSVIMFVFLLLGARLIEGRVQKKTTAALRILTELSLVKSQRLPDYPASMRIEEVDADQLAANDVLLITPGQNIPADGIVLEGSSDCDEALMTGESQPVAKTAGDELIAGAMNVGGRLIMRADKTGNQTRLSSLIEMMETAATEKPPIVLLADRHASRFLTLILLIALITGSVWAYIEPSRALWIAISVIVVTCPCALSLATPGVMSAAIGLMAKNGVLIKHGKAIQTLSKATHIVFDKTGTLTVGKLRLSDTIHLSTQGELQAEKLAFLLASGSSHPVARAIADGLAKHAGAVSDMEVTGLLEIAGGGVEACVNGRVYRLGSLAFAEAINHLPFTLAENLKNRTISVLAEASSNLLLFALEDVLRDDAVDAVHQLQQSGKKVMLMSGDRREAVEEVAERCGIHDVWAERSPADKFAQIRQLQEAGAIVAMVGDGMNDGPALALADVAVAMGQGAPISQTRSDLLLVSNRLSDLVFAFRIGRQSFRLIRENLAWAILYNVIAIPAAVVGWLEPWHAALGMSLSSLIVVLNALRLYLLPQPEYAMAADQT